MPTPASIIPTSAPAVLVLNLVGFPEVESEEGMIALVELLRPAKFIATGTLVGGGYGFALCTPIGYVAPQPTCANGARP